MNTKPQIIFDKGKPSFVVLPYNDYIALTGDKSGHTQNDSEFVPFVLSDYIKNPIRVMRIEAGLNQAQLARRLRVTQGYISRIEGRNYPVSDKLLKRVSEVLKVSRKKK
jgi:ribosome-binding protein aMBF1 (putative translation factor)